MAITQVASYTPTDRRPQAFSLSNPVALEINNQTTMRLVVFVSRTLRDVLSPGDHKIYTSLNNLAVAPTFLLVQPDDVPDSAMLSGFLTVTSYGSVNDALPAPGSYSPGTFTVPSLTVQDRSALVRSLAMVRLADFQPDPTGFVDAQPQVQAALDVARVMGGSLVYADEGTYLINTCPAHPTDGTVNVSLVMGSQSGLRGAGPGRTIFKFGTAIPNQGRMLCNYNRTSALDHDMAIEDIEFDGNAANQAGTVDAQYGPQFIWARRTLYRNVFSHDFYGTVSGGNGPNGTPGENWHLDVHNCTDCRFEHCIVADTGSNKTALGVSINSSTGVEVSGCKAIGMKNSRGFSNWHCTLVQYVNCHAYNMQSVTGGDGFNSEFSGNIIYTNCISGGVSSDQAGNPFNSATNLPNATNGFRCDNAASRHVWADCLAANNGAAGLRITNGATLQLAQIDGGAYRLNGTYGIDIADATTPAGTLVFSGSVYLANNTTAQLRYDGTNTSPVQGPLTAPAVPATTVALTNPYPFACLIRITGGTVTVVSVDGTTEATATGVTVWLARGRQITLIYSAAPSWVWRALDN